MDDRSPELALAEGTVSAILYRNEEDGYTILHLDTEADGEVTVVGILPGLSAGEGLTVHGTWTTHSPYGPQLRAVQIERRLPTGERAVYD